MKKIFVTGFFCTSFFLYPAEPGVTRAKNLGDTGAELTQVFPRPKKTSVGHALRRMSSPERVAKHPDFCTIENVVGHGTDWSPGRRIGDAFPSQEPKS